MPIKQQSAYKTLLSKSLNNKDFVSEALALLEHNLWEISLLTLQDWANAQIPSPDLFHSIAALQRPSWGVWNGVFNALRKVRTKALRTADTENREKIDRAIIIKGLLERLDKNIKTPETEEWFRQLHLNPKQSIPRKLTLQHLLSAPITLRNRIAHDTPTTDKFWQESAEVLKKLLSWLDQSSDLAEFCQQAKHLTPWFIHIDKQQWRYNGINKQNDAVLYVPSLGESQYRKDEIAAVLLIFQQLMGKTELQAKDFRRLLGKLAPEDIKGVFMGDYLVGKYIGEGAHGIVHKGVQLSTGRQVAIKFLKDQMSDEVVLRFKQEAEFLSRFTHSHIVSTYDYGEDPWVAPKAFSLEDEDWYKRFKKGSKIKTYIAMQWIEGQTLDDVYLQQKSSKTSPDLEQLTQWFVDASTAVEHVHQSDIIHRDIKPSNLMIDENGKIKLMDFGIARSYENIDTRLTIDPKQLGTPAYMSPEQITAKDAEAEVGPAADVYGLCAVFYELYTQQRLFNHSQETTLEEFITIKATEKRHPEAPISFNKKIPWELDTILSGGLENSLKDRYKNAKSLKRDLLHYQKNEPIEYQRPSLWRRMTLGYRRNRRVVKVMGMATLAIIVLSAVSFYRITEEKNVAEAATVLAEQRAEEERLAKERAKKSEKEAKLAKSETEKQLIEADHNFGLVLLKKANDAMREKKYNSSYMYAKNSILKLKPNSHEKAISIGLLLKTNNPQVFFSKENKYHQNDDIHTIKYTPNGKFIISASSDKLKIWDISSGKLTHELKIKHGIYDIGLKNNNEIIIISDKLNISIFNLKKNKLIDKHYLNEDFHRAFLSHNGKKLAYTYGNDYILLINTNTGKKIKTIKISGSDILYHMDFSHDGNYISASGIGNEGDTYVYKISTGNLIYKKHNLNGKSKFSPDGKYISLFGGDIGLKVIELSTSNIIFSKEKYDSSIIFSPNNKDIAIYGSNEIITIYDIQSKSIIRNIEINGGHMLSPGEDSSIEYSPDGKKITVVAYGKKIITFDILSDTFYKGKSTIIDPMDDLLLSLSSDEKIVSIITKNMNYSVDIKTRKLIPYYRKKTPLNNTTSDVDYSSNGNFSISINDKEVTISDIKNKKNKKIPYSNEVIMWSIELGKFTKELGTEIYTRALVSISPDNSEFITSYGTTLKLWDVKSGNIIGTLILADKLKKVEGLYYLSNSNDIILLFNDSSYAIIKIEEIKNSMRKTNNLWKYELTQDEERFSLYLDNMDFRSANIKYEHLSNTLGIPLWSKHHIEHWQLKLEKEPKNSEYMYQIGLIHDRDNNRYRPKTAEHDDNKEALKWYKKAIKAGSEEAKERLVFLQNWMKAQKDLPEEKADLYQNKVKQYKNLIKAKNTALKKQPNNIKLQWDVSDLYLQLGDLYKEKNDTDDALAHYKEAVKIRTKLAKKNQGSGKLKQGLKQSVDKIQALSAETH